MKVFGLRDVAFIGQVGSGAAPDAPFIDPTSLKIRLQGDRDVLNSGSPVVTGNPADQWVNQVVGEADALQATGASQPLWIDSGTPGGRGILRFDGTDDFFGIVHGATTNVTNPLAFYCAIKINDLASNFGMLIVKGTGGINQQYAHYVTQGSGTVTVCGSGGSCFATNSTPLVQGVWARVIVLWHTGDNETKIFIDGVKRNPSQSLLPNFVVTDALQIGRRNDGLYGELDIAEIGLFNRDLTLGEVASLDAYLVAQYGI